MVSKRPITLAVMVAIAVACISGCDGSSDSSHSQSQQSQDTQHLPRPVSLQLNWLHDPTFVGHYVIENEDALDYTVLEGGPNIAPLGAVVGGRADFAVVGADIFLKHLSDEGAAPGESELVCIFVEFQRNPVGWVVHPKTVADLGLSNAMTLSGREVNAWAQRKVNSGELKVGDKRGTESTAVWLLWRQAVKIDPNVNVVPVGFDPTIVLSAPKMLYPVYINEQPFKLSQEIGEPVLVVDPADVGVSMYGNVIVTRRNFAKSHSGVIAIYQAALREAWVRIHENPGDFSSIVGARYQSVPEKTIKLQVAKTAELVFFDTDSPGTMKDEKWQATIRALKSSNSIPGDLTWEHVRAALVPVR